jgi:hypothetical protein
LSEHWFELELGGLEKRCLFVRPFGAPRARSSRNTGARTRRLFGQDELAIWANGVNDRDGGRLTKQSLAK